MNETSAPPAPAATDILPSTESSPLKTVESASPWGVKRLYRQVVSRYPALGVLRPNRLLFGNIRPLQQNLRFWWYLWRCRFAYGGATKTSSPLVRQAVHLMRTQGYYIFEPSTNDPLVTSLAQKVQRLVEVGEASIDSEIEPWMAQIPRCLVRVPELPQLLRPEIVAAIEGYFRSHFKIYSAEIYRISPTDKAPEASGLWHTDNYPPAVLKAMVYLTDCSRTTGALRLHARRATRRLLRRGFFNRHEADHFADQLDRNPVSLEGKAGTVIVWDSNLVHRATPPTQQFRDAIAFKFLPSRESWEQHFRRMGERLCYERRGRAIPEDPAVD